MIADTYLLWSGQEDEHGHPSEANRLRISGQEKAKRIANSQMRDRMLKMLSGAPDTIDKTDDSL